MRTLSFIAYLDPGSGSLLAQLAAGGIAAVAVTGKLYWSRFKSALSPRRRDKGSKTGD